MVFLPIAGRELRVAARKPSTLWVKLIAVIVAVMIGCGFLLLSAMDVTGNSASSLGAAFFSTLSWLALATALCAGLFLTSDCLSEEKREGTLGFLFLTDLRGYDIVLGKLLATSLRGFYALLAILPVLAMAVTMGGVSGATLARTSLAIVSALAMSLCVGLFVSALSRESQQAMAGVILVLLLLSAVGPGLDAARAAAGSGVFEARWSLTSPVFLFAEALDWKPGGYWAGLGVNLAISAGLLSLTCVVLPHTWHERRRKSPGPAATWSHRWKYGSAARSVRLRARLLHINPATWLANRERWQATACWLLAAFAAGSFVALLAISAEPEWLAAWSYLGGLLALLLYVGIASHASRLFVEARRNGLLELLLSTPLTAGRIVQGQWRALLRLFGPPLALFFVAYLAGQIMVQQLTWGRIFTATTTTAATATTTAAPAAANGSSETNASPNLAATNITVAPSGAGAAGTGTPTALLAFLEPEAWMGVLLALATTLNCIVNLAALAWFGMWMGLRSRTTNLATLRTLLYVQVIPWFVITFASALAIPLLLLPTVFSGSSPASSGAIFWFPILSVGLNTLLHLAKNAFFIVWARRRLLTRFRDSVACGEARLPAANKPIPPVLPPPLAPPVIGT